MRWKSGHTPEHLRKSHARETPFTKLRSLWDSCPFAVQWLAAIALTKLVDMALEAVYTELIRAAFRLLP